MSNPPYNDYDALFFDEDDYPNIDERTCKLLGPTALVVQGLMGVVVISSLVYKRHREKPKRPWKIWSFDVSKQIVGQMFVHGVNVLISDLVAHRASGNPCVLYFLNILIDTTLGVAIIYIIHRSLTYLLSAKLHFKGFQSGQYGDPPSFTYWARQAAVYVTSLTTMKLLIIALFTAWPDIKKVGQWLLSWTGGGDAAQVIFVMGIFPIVMNILQFWLIDSIVKASALHANGGALSETAPSDPADHEPLMDGSESDDEELGGNSTHHDIENPLLLDRSAPVAAIPRRASSEERKSSSSKGSSSTEWEDEDAHLYPPSLSSSPQNSTSAPKHVTSSLKSRSQSPGVKMKRVNRKRSPPPPLYIEPQLTTLSRSGARVIAIGTTTPLTSSKLPLATEAQDLDGNVISQLSARTLRNVTSNSEGIRL